MKKKSYSPRRILNPELPSRIIDTKNLLPILKKVLIEIGYRNRTITIEIGDSFRPNEATSYHEANRGALAIVNLTPGNEKYTISYGNFGGKNIYESTIVDNDGNIRPILSNMAVIFAKIGGAGNLAKIRMRSENFAASMLSSSQVDLTKEEQIVLDIIRSWTSTYRQEYFSRFKLGRYSTEHPIIKILISKGLIIKKGSGIGLTTEGKNLSKPMYLL